jgi:hypothetical protein
MYSFYQIFMIFALIFLIGAVLYTKIRGDGDNAGEAERDRRKVGMDTLGQGFRLYRMILAPGDMMATHFRIEDEMHAPVADLTRSLLKPMAIRSANTEIEVFTQSAGSDYVGAVGGQYNNSIVFKKDGQIIAEAMPFRNKSGSVGHRINYKGEIYDFQWNKSNIYLRNTDSGTVSKSGNIIGRFDTTYSNPLKIIFAMKDDLPDELKLVLLTTELRGQYDGVWFGRDVATARQTSPDQKIPLMRRYGPDVMVRGFLTMLIFQCFSAMVIFNTSKPVNVLETLVLVSLISMAIGIALACGLGIVIGRSSASRGAKTVLNIVFFLFVPVIVYFGIFFANTAFATQETATLHQVIERKNTWHDKYGYGYSAIPFAPVQPVFGVKIKRLEGISLTKQAYNSIVEGRSRAIIVIRKGVWFPLIISQALEKPAK